MAKLPLPLSSLLSFRLTTPCGLRLRLTDTALTIMLVPILLLSACDRQSSPKPQQAPEATSNVPAETLDRSHAGTPLADLTFHDEEGKPHRLLSFSGKPLLLNFWATWCAPCVAELPTLHRLALAENASLFVVPVSEDLGSPQIVRRFWEERGFTNWPFLLDPNNDAASRYGFMTLPTTIYYDSSGHEVWRYTGGRDWMSAASDRLRTINSTREKTVERRRSISGAFVKKLV